MIAWVYNGSTSTAKEILPWWLKTSQATKLNKVLILKWSTIYAVSNFMNSTKGTRAIVYISCLSWPISESGMRGDKAIGRKVSNSIAFITARSKLSTHSVHNRSLCLGYCISGLRGHSAIKFTAEELIPEIVPASEKRHTPNVPLLNRSWQGPLQFLENGTRFVFDRRVTPQLPGPLTHMVSCKSTRTCDTLMTMRMKICVQGTCVVDFTCKDAARYMPTQ